MTNWRPVPGWEYYEVSDEGEVRSLDRVVTKKDGSQQFYKGKRLRSRSTPTGHRYVQLSKDSRPIGVAVHRLVMEAFVGPAPEGNEVCHNDGDPANNRLENLRYDTHSENAFDAVQHGVHPQARKTHCKHGHEFNATNTRTRMWKGRLHRQCDACNTTSERHRGIKRNTPEFKTLSDQYYEMKQRGDFNV